MNSLRIVQRAFLVLVSVFYVFVLCLIPQGTVAAQDATEGGDRLPPNCRVTLPADGRFTPRTPVPVGFHSGFELGVDQFWYGSEKLWTYLPIDGTWRGWNRSIAGDLADFAYSNKLPWFRFHPAFSTKDGPLTVTGKRLDGPAPSFTEKFYSNAFPRDDDNSMIMGGVNIPSFGCWEITGHYKDQELSLTVWVARPSEQSLTISGAPSAKETVSRRIQVDGATQAKSLVYRVIPEIPPAAKAAGVSGTVVLHAVIGIDGRPRDLQYISGPSPLAQAAIEAVKWWQYRVALVDPGTGPPHGLGESVEVDTTVDVVFSPSPD